MSLNNLVKRWNNLPQIFPENVNCPICFLQEILSKFKVLKAQDIFHAGQLIRYECPNCDVVFGDLRFLNLSKEEIKQDYLDLYSFYNEGDTTKYIYYIFKHCSLPVDKKYLDYACGKWNTHIQLLQKEGYDIVGYDPFVNNNESIKDQKYDFVLSNNFIEHLTNPYEDIKDMLKMLKKDGKLIFLSPCIEYVIEYTHYHTLFLKGKSLEILCNNLNLRLIKKEKIYFPFDSEFTYFVEIGV
jgi:SAM-dependent methyltransferase